MKGLQIKLPEEDYNPSQEIVNGFIEFFKENPKFYAAVEREMTIRLLERSGDSYHLRKMKEEIDNYMKSYQDGINLYKIFEEAVIRRNEQEGVDASPDKPKTHTPKYDSNELANIRRLEG
jgi:hypothetical protein